MSPLIDYRGKRAVVTGAASGIGAATARLVSELGGEVIALDVRDVDLVDVTFLHTDLGDRGSIDAALAALPDGRVDALFNCAGIANITPGQLVMGVNFLGPRYLTEGLVPRMPEGSAISFVASVGGIRWMSHLPELLELCATTDYDEAQAWCQAHPTLVDEGYSFTKEAIIVYTMTRSISLARQGIRLNCTTPGMTATPMINDIIAAHGADVVDAFPRPLGRDSTPAEQANVLAFLTSDAASYIVGTNVMADGGFLAGMTTGQLATGATAVDNKE